MSVSLLRAAVPVRLADAKTQLHGLAAGEFIAQRWWTGRRAVLDADGLWHWSRRGAKRHALPDRYAHLGRAGLALELCVLPNRSIKVCDVMVARPWEGRWGLAYGRGIRLDSQVVRSATQLEHLQRVWCLEKHCRGLLLKRKSAPYPWLVRAEQRTPDWVGIDASVTLTGPARGANP